jgi:hypothetical protein
MVGLIGLPTTGRRFVVREVAYHNDIPILDLSAITANALHKLTVSDIIQYIRLTPPRLAVVIDLTTMVDDRMLEVVVRMASMATPLQHHRNVFVVAATETDIPESIRRRIRFPGSTEVKVSAILYQAPNHLVDTCEKIELFTEAVAPLASIMQDYTIFRAPLWNSPKTPETLSAFCTRLHFNVLRYMPNDQSIDTSLGINFPVFESDWRRNLPEVLQQELQTPPDWTVGTVHRVIPAGVSSTDAVNCIKHAIPVDMQKPYALMVATEANRDQCGSLQILQPTQTILVHIHVHVDTNLIQDVIQEVRRGQSHIVHELITIRQEFSSMKRHFDEMQAEVRRKVPIGPVVPGQEVQREREEAPLEFVHVPICSKPTCKNPVVDTFRSGRCMKQCRGCRGHH